MKEEENGLIVYNAIRQIFLDNDYDNNWFWEDYFEDGDPTYFINELKEYEPDLDLSKKPTTKDIQTILKHIQEGMANSSIVTQMAGRLTDAHIGDGIIKY